MTTSLVSVMSQLRNYNNSLERWGTDWRPGAVDLICLVPSSVMGETCRAVGCLENWRLPGEL